MADLVAQLQLPALPTRSARIVVLGDRAVGKTALCCQICFGVFPLDHEPTSACIPLSKTMQMNEASHTFVLLDTASLGSLDMLVREAVAHAEAALIVFALDRLESFLRVTEFYDMLRDMDPQRNWPVILIGNKVDLHAARLVATDEAAALASYFRGHYVEITAKSPDDASFVCRTLASLLYGEPAR